MNNDCLEVDELILELVDYKNDLADVAAEKLMRKCSTSWDAYQYLRDRVHESWLPDRARQQLRQIIKRIQGDYFSVTNTAMLMRGREATSSCAAIYSLEFVWSKKTRSLSICQILQLDAATMAAFWSAVCED